MKCFNLADNDINFEELLTLVLMIYAKDDLLLAV